MELHKFAVEFTRRAKCEKKGLLTFVELFLFRRLMIGKKNLRTIFMVMSLLLLGICCPYCFKISVSLSSKDQNWEGNRLVYLKT